MFEILLILDLDFAKGFEEGREEGSDLDLPGKQNIYFFIKTVSSYFNISARLPVIQYFLFVCLSLIKIIDFINFIFDHKYLNLKTFFNFFGFGLVSLVVRSST